MPPRDPKPANSRRKPKLKLDVQEPALTAMLEKYCDLRPARFRPESHPNQVQLAQALPQPAT